MGAIKTVTFDITTNTSGAYDSSASPTSIKGQLNIGGPYLLYAVRWIDGDLADGVDAVLSTINTPSGVDTTLLTLTDANDDAWYFPRVTAHDESGTAWEDDGNSGATGERVMPIVDGQLKLVVSDGGSSKHGKCLVYLLAK